MASIVLSDIYIYPVKSLAGIQMTSWPVTLTGFKYDRNWMLIDQDGQFLSQRRLPRMALLQTNLTESALIISAPACNDLILELTPAEGKIIRSTIWSDQLNLWAISDEADAWFSEFLKLDCRLAYQPGSVVRQVDQKYGQAQDRASLSDGFPFLLISDSSLAALNKAMQIELAMTRFRPNLVVSGCEPYAEDSWREISIGSINFRLPKPCSRCAVPSIDPHTAETGKEPLTTLNRLRKSQNKVYFGQNVLHNSVGVLSVGDHVRIQKIGLNQPPL